MSGRCGWPVLPPPVRPLGRQLAEALPSWRFLLQPETHTEVSPAPPGSWVPASTLAPPLDTILFQLGKPSWSTSTLSLLMVPPHTKTWDPA